MNKSEHLTFTALALQKLYPKYGLFIESFIQKVKPFFLGDLDDQEAQIIHLIAFETKEKTKELMMDFLSLMGMQSDSFLLLDNQDINGFGIYNQIENLQRNYSKLPQIILTDFFYDYFLELPSEISYLDVKQKRLGEFLKERKAFDFSFSLPPSDSRQTLWISILSPFESWDAQRTRLTFKFLWENKIETLKELKLAYIPEDLEYPLQHDYIRKDDLLFCSENKPKRLKFSFKLLKLHRYLEKYFSQKSEFPIHISYLAIDYFSIYTLHRELSFSQLKVEAENFFNPVFYQIPRMILKRTEKIETIEIAYKAGWKINVNHKNI
ncbi:hypothetical protein Belba_0507 [Belliella baltica DSM 15883]|uniref:Uncharacterized protein n=1 Tax=Belliella baltica (strain DSM 15883 / CIP 108006 / LMG 21964 / BA134) TaxID=866536 RepID=I3Z1P7_BELBD|nr:hypothetical protein [Belliella baltica]AFL83165.1 hypothetical protein Belba_0507 [Belliella baltica DSM 15883]